MTTLSNDGIQIIRVLNNDHIYERLFRETELAFPEFSIRTQNYVLGGFGAYGNPSSYHNQMVKQLRKLAFDKIIETQVFNRYLREIRPDTHQNYKLECLFDRMMHRHKNQKPSAETAHRDIVPSEYNNQLHDNHIFGGWINLSSQYQYFVGLPGSHIDIIGDDQNGFYKLDVNSDEYRHYQNNKVKYPIAPGEMIIFSQHLLHEVLAKKSEIEQFRLFTGWRLTLSNNLLFPSKVDTINNLDIPMLPSGQLPQMFSKCHMMFKNKPFFWLGKDVDEELRGSLLRWWRTTMRVPFSRHLKSLREYNFDCTNYEYSENDRRLMLSLHQL